MADADKQIRQMVEFIKLEAEEKANEIRMKTKADADLERQMAVLNAKTKLADEFDKKEKAQALDRKIKASMTERAQKQRLLGAREEYLQKLQTSVRASLGTAASSNPAAYGTLLKGLIKQGLLRLTGDSKVDVRCRPQDAAVVKTLAPQAAAEVTAELKAAGEERPITVTVTADPSLSSSAGGVILSSMDGRIRCSNLLEERLSLAMAELQPVIRDVLFPSARSELKDKPAILDLHGHVVKAAVIHSKSPALGAKGGAGATGF